MSEGSDVGGVESLQDLITLLGVLVKTELVEVEMGQWWVELDHLYDELAEGMTSSRRQ